MSDYFLYAIGLKKDLVPPYQNCYIGVTNDIERRWYGHSKSKYTVGKFIRKNKLTFSENMIIIHRGSDIDCFALEERYRPYIFMGLNEAEGGRGGHTKYSKERNAKISKSLKGKAKSKEHIKKIIESRGNYSGSKNPNSKKWILISPENVKHTIEGNLSEFCATHKLLESCLRRNEGNIVNKPNYSGYGGYRAKNSHSKILRENTIGWTLLRV